MWRLYEKLKMGDNLLIIFKTLSILKVYNFFSLCSGQFWLYQTNEINLAHRFSYSLLTEFVYQERFS